MALFKVNRGNEANLPFKLTDGWAYFCTDTGSFLIDHYDSTDTLVRSKVNAEYADKLRYVQDGETLELTPQDINTALNNKVDKIYGKGLSTNDYTDGEKAKLDGIEEGATKTIVDDELSATSTNPVQNKVIHAKVEELQAGIDTHVNKTDNPHDVTVEQIGAAPAEHKHDASDITSGILSKSRGGTGNNSGYIRAGQKSGTDIGYASTAEGVNNTVSGDYAHAEGRNNTASGDASHAEGQNTTASNSYAHTEGYGTTASSPYSHAEGLNTTVSGNRGSHAEGDTTTASGQTSHAEGCQTVASGNYCHAEGYGTIASGSSQHVEGKYNIEHKGFTILHVVGNGTSDTARSDAHTLDWDGNAWFAGNVYVGGSGQDDGVALASTMSVTTAEYQTMSTNNQLKESTLYMLTDDTYEEDLQATVDGMNNIDYDTYLAFDITEIV